MRREGVKKKKNTEQADDKPKMFCNTFVDDFFKKKLQKWKEGRPKKYVLHYGKVTVATVATATKKSSH